MNDDEFTTRADGDLFIAAGSFNSIADLKPSRVMSLCGPEGRQAVIDFSGEAVTYSGDLPVDEAAKIFFDAVFRHFKPIT